MKLLAIIPLYQPSPSKVFNLCSFLAAGEIDVLFYINSDCKKLLMNLSTSLSVNFTIFGTGENLGTAKAYNAAAAYLLSTNEYSHLFILDQDSEPSSEFLPILAALDSDIMVRNIICPYDKKNVHRSIFTRNPHSQYFYLSQAKASGMIIPRRLFELGHSFNESLFVDYLDWLFCWQSLDYNFSVIEVGELYFKYHSLGDPYSLLGLITHNFPTLARRQLQTKSALFLLSNFGLFKRAPIIAILKILLRPLINSFLDCIQACGLLVPKVSK